MKIKLELKQSEIKYILVILSKLFYVAIYCTHKNITFISTSYVISKYISTKYYPYIPNKLAFQNEKTIIMHTNNLKSSLGNKIQAINHLHPAEL